MSARRQGSRDSASAGHDARPGCRSARSARSCRPRRKPCKNVPNGGYARPGRPARLIAERDEIERSLVARIADYARKIVSDPRSASAPRSSRSGASIARRSCLRGHNSGMYRGGRSVWWRLAIAAALIFFLVAGIGDLLWAADLGTAANVAQLVSLASIPVGLVTWATARSPGGGQAAERTICFEEFCQ